MPEDLLLELETAPPPAGSLENIEDLVRVVRRELGCRLREAASRQGPGGGQFPPLGAP